MDKNKELRAVDRLRELGKGLLEVFAAKERRWQH